MSNHPQTCPSVSLTSPSTSDIDVSALPQMDWLQSAKPKRPFYQQLVGWMLLASAAIHGLLLLIPFPTEHSTPAIKPEAKKVRVTQLPMLTKAPKKTTASVKPAIAKLPSKLPSLAPPIVVRSTIPAIAPKKPPSPPAVATKPAISSQSLAPDLHGGQEPLSSDDPWNDFPKYPTAQPGCRQISSCFQTSDRLGAVTAFFQKELAHKKYDVTIAVQEAERIVYQVSRNHRIQYLNIFESQGQTLYLLSDQPQSLSDLAQAIEVPPEIAAIFMGLDAQEVAPQIIAQPNLFFTGSSKRSEIVDMQAISLASGETVENFFDSSLSTNLRNNQFEFSGASQSYGGGPLYVVKRGELSLYINVVPTVDQKGVIVAVWKSQPK